MNLSQMYPVLLDEDPSEDSLILDQYLLKFMEDNIEQASNEEIQVYCVVNILY